MQVCETRFSLMQSPLIMTTVIGCDGIKSRVREIMFGKENPVSHATYTHKVAYRGLIPMDKAVEALGEYKAKNQHMHLGPKAHVLHFPVANQTLMNVVAFASDPNEWDDSKTYVAPATRKEVEDVFADWGPTVRNMISLLPNDLDKWAVFDSAAAPAPCYNRGRVCIAGDAAHAAAPHHGAGAGVGIEDALCLATLLDKAVATIQDNKATKAQALGLVFTTFNAVRRKRTQWLVKSSHDVAEIYEWNHPKTGADASKCFEEIKRRSHKIWYFDYEGMLKESCDGFEWRIVIQALLRGDRDVQLPITENISENASLPVVVPESEPKAPIFVRDIVLDETQVAEVRDTAAAMAA
jgi:salicylate hydroxylase